MISENGMNILLEMSHACTLRVILSSNKSQLKMLKITTCRRTNFSLLHVKILKFYFCSIILKFNEEHLPH